MNKLQVTLGAAAGCLAATFAQADEHQRVSDNGTVTGMFTQTVGEHREFSTIGGFANAQACLDAGWLHSTQAANRYYAYALTVSCYDQDGNTVAAQTCFENECQTLVAPGMRPE